MTIRFFQVALAFALASAITIEAASAASETKLYLWSDQTGLLPAKACTPSEQTNNPLAADEIANEVLALKGPLLKKSSSTDELEVFASRVFLQAAMKGDLFLALDCGSGRTYFLFDVFVPESSEAIARVGIRPRDAGVLKDAQALNVRKAQKLIRGIAITSSANKELRPKTSPPTAATEADSPAAPEVFGVPFAEGRKKQAPVVRTEIAQKSEKPTEGCCEFPMIHRPLDSYLEGMRRFGANRDGGARIHAACDLYRPEGEAVRAITGGQVLRNKYYFYLGVYALEVRHDNGWVVRYGEVTGRTAPGTAMGSRVGKGQTVGYVGWIDGHSVPAMLHFELYSGRASGPLTQTWNSGFQRREDLLNPTRYLQKWEKAQFGQNW